MNLSDYFTFLSQLQNKIVQQIFNLYFFYTMKPNKLYSLATSQQDYIHLHEPEKGKNQGDTIINIFSVQEIEKLTEKDLNDSKNYEVVGWNILKTYQNTMTRLQKKNSMKSDRPVSKTSSIREKNDLLDKQQVISRLPKITKKKPIQMQIHQRHSNLPKQRSSAQMMKFLSQHRPPSKFKPHINPISHQFSVNKLKNKIEEHNAEWKQVFRHQKDNVKFPSLNRSIELNRSKVEQKELNSLAESRNNMKNDLWTQVLRKDIEMSDIYGKKSVIKTFNDKGQFTAHGVSKLQLQKEWITQKDTQGYKFKLYQDDKSSQQTKKVSSIR